CRWTRPRRRTIGWKPARHAARVWLCSRDRCRRRSAATQGNRIAADGGSLAEPPVCQYGGVGSRLFGELGVDVDDQRVGRLTERPLWMTVGVRRHAVADTGGGLGVDLCAGCA